jgi:fructose-bisphosphate aldolase class II
LYTHPEDIWLIHKELSAISPRFTIAAAFGNVHGVYAAGNVQLRPELLGEFQAFCAKKLGGVNKKPLFFVFHGGSGSTADEIQQAVSHGVVKMNVDTDMQWAYWNGIRKWEKVNHDYLQSQLGNHRAQQEILRSSCMDS